jgi:hypothetical protein
MQVAALITWLASPYAGDMNGEIVRLDDALNRGGRSGTWALARVLRRWGPKLQCRPEIDACRQEELIDGKAFFPMVG